MTREAGLLAKRPPRHNADLPHRELFMDGKEERGLVCRGMQSSNYSPIFVPILLCWCGIVSTSLRAARIGSVLLSGARDHTQVPPLPISCSSTSHGL